MDLVSLTTETEQSAELCSLCDAGFALAMQMLRHRDDAKDIVQSSLYTLLTSTTYDPQKGKPKHWFLKIVRNRCLDQIRKRAASSVEDVPVDHLPQSEKGPDLIVEEKELHALLKLEISRLSEEQREILLLRDFHGLSYSEIADVLSIAKGTVMSRLHRARSELRQRMQGDR